MHPDYQVQSIPCQCITFSDAFVRQLHEDPADSAFIASLQGFGQTAPLLVWQHTNDATTYQLLAGYSIFDAMVSLGIKKIICRVLPLTIPPTYRYSLQILHGLATPEASPILQAHLLQQAQQQLTESEVLSLLSLMGYAPQRYILDELTAFLRLSPAAILALHRGILAPKTGKLLQRLSLEDQETLVQLINVYRPGGSKQRKLVEMVTELSLRNDISVQEMVGHWLPDQDCGQKNRTQGLQGLLYTLQALYWPERTKMEKEFQQFLQELQVPEGVTIVPSPSFEDESMEIRLCFANSGMLLEKWQQIKALIKE